VSDSSGVRLHSVRDGTGARVIGPDDERPQALVCPGLRRRRRAEDLEVAHRATTSSTGMPTWGSSVQALP
jgi:hypothetical protein